MEFDYLVVNAGAAARLLRRARRGARRLRPPADSASAWPTSAKMAALAAPRAGVSALRRAASSTSPTGTSSRCRPSTTSSPTRTTSTTPRHGLGRAFGFADLEPQQTVAYEIGLQQALRPSRSAVDLTALLQRHPQPARHAARDHRARRRRGLPARSATAATSTATTATCKGFTLASRAAPTLGGSGSTSTTRSRSREATRQRPARPCSSTSRPASSPRSNSSRSTGTAATSSTCASPSAHRGGIGLVSARRPARALACPTRRRRPTSASGSRTRPAAPARSTSTSSPRGRSRIGGLRPGLFLRVYNLLDTDNVTNIYSDTGLPLPNLRYYPGAAARPEHQDEFLQRPDFYAAPRQVQVGLARRRSVCRAASA